MAFWVVRKGCVPDILSPQEYNEYGYGDRYPAKRRSSGGSFDQEDTDHFLTKRLRLDTTQRHHFEVFDHEHHNGHADVHVKHDVMMAAANDLPFIIIREHQTSSELCSSPHADHQYGPHSPHIHLLNPTPHSSAPMERTASGHSISSSDSPPPEEPASLMSDSAAAQLVHKHLSSVNRNARHARILRALVYPKTPSRSRDFIIDQDALESIFSAANDLFFANKLRGRVTWDWSHPDMASAGRYDCAIVGTTALRKRRGPKGGYETLIVLSSPILKDTKYNRRLLISTFLHEMIHSFLFVMCGRKAGINGGHTEGFRKIAADIDGWVGRECLRLTDMEADLDRFTVDEQCFVDGDTHSHRSSVTFTDLDARHHRQHHHEHHNMHHYQQHHRQHQEGYGGVQHDEMETSLRHPPSEGYSHSTRAHHAHLPEHGGEGWQWQPREGFGAPRGAY